MPKPIFTAEHIALWNRDLDDVPPSPTELEWPAFTDITAFKGGALSAGAVLRLKTRDDQVIDLRMNPVAAREIAHWLFHAGRQAGWLDSEMNVISPLADFDA